MGDQNRSLMQVNHSRPGVRKEDKVLQIEAAEPPDNLKHRRPNH